MSPFLCSLIKIIYFITYINALSIIYIEKSLFSGESTIRLKSRSWTCSLKFDLSLFWIVLVIDLFRKLIKNFFESSYVFIFEFLWTCFLNFLNQFVSANFEIITKYNLKRKRSNSLKQYIYSNDLNNKNKTTVNFNCVCGTRWLVEMGLSNSKLIKKKV